MTTSGTSQAGSTVRSVERALAILTTFTVERPELTLDEISAAGRLPKSTVHRLLHTLVSTGAVERGQRDGSYRLSLLAAQIGGVAMQDVANQALERRRAIKALSEQTGETVSMSVLAKDVAVVVDRVASPQLLKYTIHVGSRLPAHATASGKVLLAEQPESELDELYAGRELPTFTSATVSSLPALKDELQKIREQGYALDDEELAQGLRCVAVPVHDWSTQTLYGLGIAGVAARVGPDDLLEFRTHLSRAAELIELSTSAVG